MKVSSLRNLAVVLCCEGVIALLTSLGVAAQATDGSVFDFDDDGLIEVASRAQLNAIRWDRNGNGAADPVYWDHDNDPDTPEQIDESATEANANSYARCLSQRRGGHGLPQFRLQGVRVGGELEPRRHQLGAYRNILQ